MWVPFCAHRPETTPPGEPGRHRKPVVAVIFHRRSIGHSLLLPRVSGCVALSDLAQQRDPSKVGSCFPEKRLSRRPRGRGLLALQRVVAAVAVRARESRQVTNRRA